MSYSLGVDIRPPAPAPSDLVVKMGRQLQSTLDRLGLETVTMIGHSFGGGIELGFASAFPGRVEELVFSDTLAVSHEWGLADEAMRHPLRLLWLATPTPASAAKLTKRCRC